MSDPEENKADAACNAVALKLPQFWPADPQIWFAQVEAQFATRKITNQDTKFYYVVASLSPEVAADIRDLLIQKPTDNAYNELKKKLLERTTTTKAQKLQQLLASEELGDRKPSQLLRRFQQLLDDSPADHPLIRELFLQRLPQHVRQLLSVTTQSTTPLEELAKLADKAMEVQTFNVSSVQRPPESTGFDNLQAQLNEINKTLATLSRKQEKPANQPQAASSVGKQSLCFYHQRFGNKARKCQQPCSYSQENDRVSM